MKFKAIRKADSAARRTSLTRSTGSATIDGYTLSYDADGRITGLSTSVDGSVAYSYYNDGQLKSATPGTGSSLPSESYSYDADGNRTGGTDSTGTDNRVTNDGTYTYQTMLTATAPSGRASRAARMTCTPGITATG